jgi:hypothetical protein
MQGEKGGNQTAEKGTKCAPVCMECGLLTTSGCSLLPEPRALQSEREQAGKEPGGEHAGKQMY